MVKVVENGKKRGNDRGMDGGGDDGRKSEIEPMQSRGNDENWQKRVIESEGKGKK